MSIYMLVFFGTMPVSALLAGRLADIIGAPQTVYLDAALLAVVALTIWWRMPFVRRAE